MAADRFADTRGPGGLNAQHSAPAHTAKASVLCRTCSLRASGNLGDTMLNTSQQRQVYVATTLHENSLCMWSGCSGLSCRGMSRLPDEANEGRTVRVPCLETCSGA